MKLLTCPLNGKRNISEFTYGGEYHVMPDHRTSSARDWQSTCFFMTMSPDWSPSGGATQRVRFGF